MLAEIASYPVKGLFAGIMYAVFILAAILGLILGKGEVKKRAKSVTETDIRRLRRFICLKVEAKKAVDERESLSLNLSLNLNEPKPESVKKVLPKKEPSKEPLTSKDVVRDTISGLKNLGYSVRESKLIVNELAKENKYECSVDLIRDVFKHARK